MDANKGGEEQTRIAAKERKERKKGLPMGTNRPETKPTADKPTSTSLRRDRRRFTQMEAKKR